MVTLWGTGGVETSTYEYCKDRVQPVTAKKTGLSCLTFRSTKWQRPQLPPSQRTFMLKYFALPPLPAVTTEFVIPAKVWWWLLLTPPAPCLDVSEFYLSSSLCLYGGAIDQSCEIFWSKHCLSQLSFFLFVPSTLFDSYPNGCLHHHLFKTFLPPCQVPLSFTCPQCFPAARGPVSEIFLSRDQLHSICCWPHERWVSQPPRQGGGQKNSL